MASSQPMSGRPHHGQVVVDAARLWGGGLATACVAALVALVGVLVFGVVLDITLVRPALLLDVADTFTADYALTAFLLALLATGVAHGLALTTPRPRLFFSWIVGLATVAGVAAPFADGSVLESQAATAAINLFLGVSVLSLLRGVMSRTVSVNGTRGT